MKIAITSNGAFVDQRDGSLVEGRLSVYLRDSDDLATTYTLEGNDFVQAQNPVLLHSGLPDDTLFADAGIYRLKVEKYTGPEGQMSVDADPAYFEQIDIYEVGFDWDSAMTIAQNVDTIEDLRSVDPSVGSVNVLSYYSVGDCCPRTYVWDGASVDQIDGGYVVGSDVSDTGRWILVWGDEILPCTVYGVSAGHEANLNSLFQYPRLVGSFSFVTAPCIRFTRGDYTSSTSFVTDKQIVMDGDARFTLATVQCPKVSVLGTAPSYNGNFVLTATDSEVHSSWFRTLMGFWKCGASVLYIDGTNHFESNVLNGNVNLSGYKIIGDSHLDATFSSGAFYTVSQRTTCTGRIFNHTDYVKITGHGDGMWLTSGAWDPGTISAGHHVEWQNTPDLDLFENADRWLEVMVERRTRITNMGDTLDFQNRAVGSAASISTGLFTDIRNLTANIVTVSNPGEDVTLTNVHTERLHASCNALTLSESSVYFGEEPSVNYLSASSSDISVGGTAWRSNGITVSVTGSKVSGLVLDRNGDNETKDSQVGFTDCTLVGCTLGSKSLALSGNTVSGCTVKVYPYSDGTDYRLDLVFRGNSSMGANPVEFTKAVESEDCFGCILNVAIVGNQFLGNAEGLRMRYWSNRTGIAYSNTFVKEGIGHAVAYSGNSGLCPSESMRGLLVSDATAYTQQSVDGGTVYKYSENRRCFPSLAVTQWWNQKSVGTDTLVKVYTNTGASQYDMFMHPNYSLYFRSRDDTQTDGDFFSLGVLSISSPISINGSTEHVSAKFI